MPVLRRLGLGTEAEIGGERYALKALRGDFRDVELAAKEQVQQKATDAVRAV